MIRGIKFHSLEQARGLVQLTKWLPGLREEMDYLFKEHIRISSDPSRTCFLVHDRSRYALFVNDLTGGEFERLEDE